MAKAPPDLVGRGLVERVLLTVLTRPRPQEGVAFAALVVEQVRVDRRIEGRVVELEREVVASFFRALGPRGADLGPPDKDAVTGRVFIGGATLLGDDTDAF